MIDKLKALRGELSDLRRDVRREKVDRIAKKDLRKRAEALATNWFQEVEPTLAGEYGVPIETLKGYSHGFTWLLKLSAPNNLKKSYCEALEGLLRGFRDQLVLPLQRTPSRSVRPTDLDRILSQLPYEDENEYLGEAAKCAERGYLRGAVVLAWCAAIDRVHRVVEKIGFQKFNVTSAWMASQRQGRFKRFNSPQNVGSLSELREVFDSIVLWVVEGMALIGSNQHMRLNSCFLLRCHCAHPGEAPVTPYNVLSFFSDLSEIIWKNEKFQV